jgi:outer membrane lipoprotein-sorting protein
MRRIVCLATTLTLALAACGTARADEQADLKALIDKAIKAQGGEANLTKYKAETFKMKGKFYDAAPDGADYTGEWAVQQPDKMRFQIKFDGGSFTQVFDGKKLWQKLGDDVKEVDDKDEIAETKEELYAGRVSSLVPLKDKEYTLAPLGEIKVNGKPAVGVLVKSKGHRDVSLYFDKDTNLLVKTANQVKNFRAGGKEVTQEAVFSDYKEVKGVQHPLKIAITHDGKKFVDGQITDYEPKEKLDDSVFAKP